MNRRYLIPALGVTIGGVAAAQTTKKGVNLAALAKTAGACVSTGEVCLQHCITMMGAGSKDMATCAKTVRELIAVCEALEKLALQNAPSLSKQAAIAAEVCKRCDAQCRKYASMLECKACADACVACAAECAKA